MMPNKINSKRGSALMIALVFAAIITFLSAAYLKMAMGERKQAKSAYYSNALLNLTEAAAEDASWSLQKEDWVGWINTGMSMVKQEENIDLGGVQKGTLNVIVYDYAGVPIVFAEGRTKLPNGTVLRKQVRMELFQRSLFANGMTSKDSLRFSGNNAFVDSFDSSKGPYDPFLNRNDNGTAASVSVEVDVVNLQNADIWGFVATGKELPAVGSQGSILGEDSPADSNIDMNRVATDFYAEFPDVDPPSTAGANTSLPGGLVIGTAGAGAPEVYRLSEIGLKMQDTLVIDGPVVIVVDGDVNVKGAIEVTANGSVEMYVNGSMDIGGRGMANMTNVASKMIVYGTNKTPLAEEIKLHGNGAMVGAIYAPNYEFSMRGGGNSGEMYGAVVAGNITVNGNMSFHYDEALGNFAGGDPTFKLNDWRELSLATDRLDFDALIAQAKRGEELDLGSAIDRVVPLPPPPPAFLAPNTETMDLADGVTDDPPVDDPPVDDPPVDDPPVDDPPADDPPFDGPPGQQDKDKKVPPGQNK